MRKSMKWHLGFALELAVLATTALACATPGPMRPTVMSVLESPPPSASKPCAFVPVGCEKNETGRDLCAGVQQIGTCPQGATAWGHDANGMTAPLFLYQSPALSESPPTSTPFAAGFLAGMGYRLGEVEGSRLVPLQLVTGSAALTKVGDRTISALGIVGVSGTSVSSAQGAWGFGGSMELTDGKRPYEAGASTGLVWFSNGGPPAAFIGLTIVSKL